MEDGRPGILSSNHVVGREEELDSIRRLKKAGEKGEEGKVMEETG